MSTIIFPRRTLNQLQPIERAIEAQLRSSARRHVRQATTIRCGGALVTAPARDPFQAAELAIADLVGASR